VNPRTKYNPSHACEKKNGGGSHSKLTLACFHFFRKQRLPKAATLSLTDP
jgi:hypothetical protein